MALLTALLFVAACITIWQGRKQIKKLMQEASERHDRDERSQASLVSAWVDQWGDTGLTGRCRNGSEEAVYDVTIEVVSGVRRWHIPLMRPLEDREFTDTQLTHLVGYPHVAVRFVDASGRRWERTPTGSLIRRLDETTSSETATPGEATNP